MKNVVIMNLCLCLLLLAGTAGAAERGSLQGGRAGERPNIVWFVTEDMGPDFNCYGEPAVHTPNFDRLAEEGMRYTRCFSSTPVCSSNRSAFMTGMHASSIDAQHHRSHRNDDFTLPRGVRVITDWLRPAGYHTGLIWKGKRDWNFNYEGRAGKDKPYDTREWSELVKHEPFFAQVQVSESHRDFHGPKKTDPEKVEVPPYYPDHPKVRKDWARYLDSVSVADNKFGKLLTMLEEAGVADNTIVIVMADHGRAMVRGKQWPYDSGVQIPLLVRWPKGIEPPENYKAGTVSGRMISQIDVTATTLWAAGVQPPMLMQGRVFLGPRANLMERKYAFSGRGRGDETEFRIRSVRSKRYRYIRNWHPKRPFLQRNEYKERQYPVIDLMRQFHSENKLTPVQEKLLASNRPKEELYYIPEDPHQIENLIDSKKTKHRMAQSRLRGALDAWMAATNDQGRFPESKAVLKRAQASGDRRWSNWKKDHPEKYKRFKRLQAEWNRKDANDRANDSHRRRVWKGSRQD